MSDPVSTPSNPTDSAPTDPILTDPNARTPTDSDPSATDPSSTTPTDPNAGATDPNAGTTPTDPNAGAVDPPQTTGVTSLLPGAVPAASTTSLPELPANPTATAGSDNQSTQSVDAIDNNSGNFRKAIIIASSVSGALALILAAVVIYIVYRRRNRRIRGRKPTFDGRVPRISKPKMDRPASDATWIGTRISNPDNASFDESKLEAGIRTSEAGSLDSEATLADITEARKKSGAFTTPTHTPRPSMEKIRVASAPLVPQDPFEAPRLSLADRPRPSVGQAFPEAKAPTTTLPKRKSAASHMRINSTSTYRTDVEIDQEVEADDPSPRFIIPLMTPLEPPAEWRAQSEDEFPLPSRRDSMASLSRQSSRASSRNSFVADTNVTSPSKKGVFTSLAKKRRSRGDSIDPFRKSAGLRRKSLARVNSTASSIVRRKSSMKQPKSPKSPGTQRKSRTGTPTTPRRRSNFPPPNPIADPTQNMSFSMASEQIAPSVQGISRTPRTPMLQGLPKTPRTPTAARQSRVMNGPRISTTPRTAAPPLPYTPRTSIASSSREPRTPRASIASSSREPRTPRASSEREPRTPSTSRERDPRTPNTAGGRSRTPRAPLPRTPTSLDDAHWDAVPLPSVPVSAAPVLSKASRPVPRPLPSAPLARAELRLSQLSRAVSDVSRESPI